jgi:uncharacterized membrane protein
VKPSDSTPGRADPLRRQGWFGQTVKLVVAPLVLLCSGFFTADFLLSGLYTWPRTSRILALTLTVVILSYEFVYKEQQAGQTTFASDHAGLRALRALLYSCVIPYAVGVLTLLVLVRLASA